MGFNFSGLAINKNYESDIDKLIDILELDLENQELVLFEDAVTNSATSDYIYFYFSQKGTLILMDDDSCLSPYKIDNNKCLTFVINEYSMSHFLAYCEGDDLLREKMVTDEMVLTDFGEPLKGEDPEDLSETIIYQIGAILNKSFFEIEADERVLRFSFVNRNDIIEEPSSKPDIKVPFEAPIQPPINKQLEKSIPLWKKIIMPILFLLTHYLGILLLDDIGTNALSIMYFLLTMLGAILSIIFLLFSVWNLFPNIQKKHETIVIYISVFGNIGLFFYYLFSNL